MTGAPLRGLFVWGRPLAFFAATLAGAVALVVVLVSAAPGNVLDACPALDPEVREELTARYALDQPWYVQAGSRLATLAALDLDISLCYRSGARVADLLAPAFASSAQTVAVALLLAFVISGLAVYFVERRPRLELALEGTAAIVSMVPAFVAAVVIQALFGGTLGLEADIRHLLAAALVLALADGLFLDLFRHLRSEVRAARVRDPVVAARANGLGARRVLFASLFGPVAELVTSRLSLILGAVLVVEIPLGLYGVGEVLYQSASRRDVNVVVGCLVVLAAVVCAADLVRRWLQMLVDPRLRQAGSAGE